MDHDMGSQKDNLATQVILGIAIPASLLILVVYNISVGWVYSPHRAAPRGMLRFVWSDDGAVVCFWVMFKMAAIVAMVSWFLLANHDQTEHLTMLGVVVAMAMIVVGTMVAVMLAVA